MDPCRRISAHNCLGRCIQHALLCAAQYLEWGGALIGMLINLFWLSAPKPLKVTIYTGLGWLVRLPGWRCLHNPAPQLLRQPSLNHEGHAGQSLMRANAVS